MGRFLNADALISTGQGLAGFNMFSYCNNNPMLYTDHTGKVDVLFWSFVAVTSISAGGNAISTWISGGSMEDCFNAALAGGAGGAAGFGVAMLFGFTPHGNIAGRATATFISDLGTAWLMNDEVTASDIVFACTDVILDVSYSAVGYYYAEPIKNELVGNALNAGLDALIDIGETYLFYSNKPSASGASQTAKGSAGFGGLFCHVAILY